MPSESPVDQSRGAEMRSTVQNNENQTLDDEDCIEDSSEAELKVK